MPDSHLGRAAREVARAAAAAAAAAVAAALRLRLVRAALSAEHRSRRRAGALTLLSEVSCAVLLVRNLAIATVPVVPNIESGRASALTGGVSTATMATPLLSHLSHVHVSDADLSLLNHMVRELPVRSGCR